MSSPLPKKKPVGEDQAVTAMADQDQLEADNAAAGNPTPGSPQDADPAAPPNPLNTVDQAAINEDWTKVATWDVTDAAGKIVTTLDGLAEVMDTDRTGAAGQLLGSPMAAAAPAELIAEAEQEVNPGGDVSLLDEFDDDTLSPVPPAEDEDPEIEPDDDVEDDDELDEDAEEDDEDEDDDVPPWAKKNGTKAFPWQKGKKKGPDTGSSTRKETIAAGAFVSWSGGKGKVEVVVTNGGKVPGVDTEITGTKDEPACRVRVYDAEGTATDERVAVKASSLKTIPPLGAAKFGKKDASAGLVLLVSIHAGAAGSGKPTAEAIQEVYARGQQSWPGETKTLLSAREWALGRAEAFVRKAEGYHVPNYVGDDDLLP